MHRHPAFQAATLAALISLPIASAQAQGSARALEATGQLDVIHIDAMESGQAHFRFFLEDDATGDRYELRLPRNRLDGLYSGKRVKVRGRAHGGGRRRGKGGHGRHRSACMAA